MLLLIELLSKHISLGHGNSVFPTCLGAADALVSCLLYVFMYEQTFRCDIACFFVEQPVFVFLLDLGYEALVVLLGHRLLDDLLGLLGSHLLHHWAKCLFWIGQELVGKVCLVVLVLKQGIAGIDGGIRVDDFPAVLVLGQIPLVGIFDFGRAPPLGLFLLLCGGLLGLSLRLPPLLELWSVGDVFLRVGNHLLVLGEGLSCRFLSLHGLIQAGGNGTVILPLELGQGLEPIPIST